jgi:hypothetical protein
MSTEILVAIFFACACLSTWATFRIAGDDLSSRNQRIAQTVFVWLLPILGAMLVLHLQRKELERGSGKYSEQPDPGDDFGMSGRTFKQTKTALESDTQSDVGAGNNE